MELEKSKTEPWEAGVEPPFTTYRKFTFFNVENPDEIKTGGKPSVREIGDFAYREVRRKEQILTIQDEISFGR